MKFGMGEEGGTIELPDPRLCNLHLAVARVFAASGFAELVDKYERDHEGDVPTTFGGVLQHRLEMLSVSG
jgi:hypothetical protein